MPVRFRLGLNRRSSCRWPRIPGMVGRDAGPVSTAQRAASAQPRRRVDGRLVVLLVVVALYSRGTLSGSLNPVVLRTWTTVFVAIVTQALPFLVLGVLVSGAITALVSPTVLERLLATIGGAGGAERGPGRGGVAGV
jgi:threonine/homoserine/homoserine lactone efflux protein